ncbi:MAG: phosphatase PAP2 family protein [Bacteroidales bacterium]|nr:phosphatase PAP2 family protein [Bacteroidales bacterium]
MKQLLAILLLFSTLTVRAQWDTAGLRLQRFSVAPALSATALMATGTIFTYNSTANSVSLSIRNAVVSSRNPRLHFDDYIQYLPAALPLALNLCGVKGKHSFGRLLMLEGGSYLLGAGWLTAFKYGLAVQRPDGSTFNSFPSGHTFTAFTGAEIIRREYGAEYPWLAVAGYAVAITVAAMRVYNNRHWLGDVCAGAGLGILSVTLVYWTLE